VKKLRKWFHMWVAWGNNEMKNVRLLSMKLKQENSDTRKRDY